MDSWPEGSVLLISEPLLPGGISVYTHSILDGLSTREIKYVTLTSAAPAENLLSASEMENVQVVDGLFWISWRPFLFRRIVRWAEDREPLLIHGLSAVTTQVCAHLSKALGIPFIVTVHHFQKRGSLRLEKNCKGFIAVSEVLRENIVNDAHIPRDIVHLIPAGIRVEDDNLCSVKKNSIPLVSSFGKLIRRKDFQTFLKAARRIVDVLGENVSFVISGEGPDESVLRKLAHDLKIEKQVTFVHGSASHAQLLRDTDVYVQCSRSEGFGTMVLQAMAHGVPVVATSTGGILSLIRHGENGFLIPPGEAEALANHILQLLADEKLRQQIGTAARLCADKDFNLAHMMSKTLELYDEVLTGNSQRTTKMQRIIS